MVNLLGSSGLGGIRHIWLPAAAASVLCQRGFRARTAGPCDDVSPGHVAGGRACKRQGVRERRRGLGSAVRAVQSQSKSTVPMRVPLH